MARTIAAIATPIGEGGVSMIRISGENSHQIADKIFSPVSGKKLETLAGYTAAYGSFIDEKGDEIDTGVALVYRAPFSYTGENVVELTCHGGIYVTNVILDIILKNGAKMADPGEFTKIAFLNGKMNLIEAESIMDIISAKSKQALKIAENASKGALYERIEKVTEELLNISGFFGAWFDYPEEEIKEIEPQEIRVIFEKAISELEDLMETYEQGKLIREGIKTAIVGKPNVGKSTLMNLLAKSQKSIVTDVPGTTRDVVEEQVKLGNLMLNLADTAGIRFTDDSVEKIGVELARKKIDTAELILVLFDGSRPLSKEDDELIEVLRGNETPKIAIINKIDIIDEEEKEKLENTIRKEFENVVLISAKDGVGAEELEAKIGEVLNLNQIVVSDPMIATRRQLSLASSARGYLTDALDTLNIGYAPDLISINLEAAIGELLELTGERATDRTVDNVFSKFCVGK